MRLRVTLPDFHRAIKFIGDFQNFQLQILVERLRAQKCVNLCLSFGGLLTSDKRVEPAQEKKDFAFPLDLRQGFERRFQKGQRQLGLVPVIKRSQALLDPVFRARRNLQIIGEIALLGRAFRPRGARAISSFEPTSMVAKPSATCTIIPRSMVSTPTMRATARSTGAENTCCTGPLWHTRPASKTTK